MNKINLYLVFAILILCSPSFAQKKSPELKLIPLTGFLNRPTSSNFVNPTGVALDSKGNVYVAHHGTQQIMVFDMEGKYLKSLAEGILITPHGLRVDRNDNLWITDLDQHVVIKLNPSGITEMILGQRNTSGEYNDELKMGLFNRPADLAFDSEENIYVADGYGNSRIAKFDKNGKYLMAWGTKGSEQGQFDNPHNIIIDANDRVYVADRNNLRVQVFNTQGEFIEEWSHLGKPWGLTITNDQTIYLGDGTNGKIYKLNTKGKVQGEYSNHGKQPGQILGAHGMAVDNEGNIYVTEVFNWRVEKFKIED